MLSGNLLEFLQNLHPVKHLMNHVWTQKIVVYLIQPVRIFPAVTHRPFLRITYCAHTLQVGPRHNKGSILLLYKIRERKVRSILMTDMPSHNQRECTNPCRPQYI